MPISNFSDYEDVEKYRADQPRAQNGRWTADAAAAAANPPKHEGHWDVRHRVDTKDVVDVSDAASGAKLLDDGKFIKADVKTAVDIVREGAKLKSNADLTNMEIKGTPLMTQNNVGIPRRMMPQVEPENKEKWVRDTKAQGVKITESEADPATLKPIQSEISLGKVGGIMGQIESGAMDLSSGKLADRIIVSKDGYVVDGHHRWAAAAMVSLDKGGIKIPVLELDLDYKDSLQQVLDWNKENGVKLKDLSDNAQKALDSAMPALFVRAASTPVVKYNEGQPRDRMGRFASGGGGGSATERDQASQNFIDRAQASKTIRSANKYASGYAESIKTRLSAQYNDVVVAQRKNLTTNQSEKLTQSSIKLNEARQHADSAETSRLAGEYKQAKTHMSQAKTAAVEANKAYKEAFGDGFDTFRFGKIAEFIKDYSAALDMAESGAADLAEVMSRKVNE